MKKKLLLLLLPAVLVLLFFRPGVPAAQEPVPADVSFPEPASPEPPNAGTVPDSAIEFGGISVSADAESIDLSGREIADLAALEAALPRLPNLKFLDMSHCGIPDEDMDLFNRRHPEIQIVWTVRVAGLEIRTDETTFMPVKHNIVLTSREAYPLRYCTEMVCIDIGHMDQVTDCEWAVFMPKLKYLLMGKTSVSDLSPLYRSENLIYLEIFSTPVKDYTPLLGCTALEDLNLGMTYGDPEPITKMTWLRHLWWCDAPNRNYGIADRMESVAQALPGTELKIWLDHPCAGGWRKLPNYYAMRDLLGMYYID